MAGLVPSLSGQVLFAAQPMSQPANYREAWKVVEDIAGDICPSPMSHGAPGHIREKEVGGRINNKSILQQLQPNSTALTGSLAYTLAEVFQLPWPDSEGCEFAGRLKKQQQQNFINPQTAMSLIIHPLVRTLPSIGPKAAKRFMGRKFTFLRKKKKKHLLSPGDALATASPCLQCEPKELRAVSPVTEG